MDFEYCAYIRGEVRKEFKPLLSGAFWGVLVLRREVYGQDLVSGSEQECDLKVGSSEGISQASAKARDQRRALFGALKRSFPRMNAGAPTGGAEAAATKEAFRYW